MLKLTLILALCGTGDDLHDRLLARLQQMKVQARESVFHVLENLPREKRREASREFLQNGREAFEKRFHAKECCPDIREELAKWRARFMKRVLENISGEWKRMPNEEKQAIFKCLMDIYKGLPDESKKALMKEIQSQMFKGFGAQKKKK